MHSHMARTCKHDTYTTTRIHRPGFGGNWGAIYSLEAGTPNTRCFVQYSNLPRDAFLTTAGSSASCCLEKTTLQEQPISEVERRIKKASRTKAFPSSLWVEQPRVTPRLFVNQPNHLWLFGDFDYFKDYFIENFVLSGHFPSPSTPLFSPFDSLISEISPIIKVVFSPLRVVVCGNHLLHHPNLFGYFRDENHCARWVTVKIECKIKHRIDYDSLFSVFILKAITKSHSAAFSFPHPLFQRASLFSTTKS